jgi:hypothetical protein
VKIAHLLSFHPPLTPPIKGGELKKCVKLIRMLVIGTHPYPSTHPRPLRRRGGEGTGEWYAHQVKANIKPEAEAVGLIEQSLRLSTEQALRTKSRPAPMGLRSFSTGIYPSALAIHLCLT